MSGGRLRPRTKDIDVLLYDKVQWERACLEGELIEPVQLALAERGLRVATIRYGLYREEDFQALVRRSRAMVFLCEHETQGIAYQQVLASGVPILAWDRGGEWRDPSYHPDRVRYGPVTTVPYWDRRCGLTFRCADDFPASLDHFLANLRAGDFSPRDYIIENLTLEKCAQDYLTHVAAVARA